MQNENTSNSAAIIFWLLPSHDLDIFIPNFFTLVLKLYLLIQNWYRKYENLILFYFAWTQTCATIQGTFLFMLQYNCTGFYQQFCKESIS